MWYFTRGQYLWKQSYSAAETKDIISLKTFVGIGKRPMSCVLSPTSGGITLEQKIDILCGSVLSISPKTMKEYASKAGSFLRWHKTTFPHETDCIVSAGKMINLITDLDTRNLEMLNAKQHNKEEKKIENTTYLDVLKKYLLMLKESM